MSLKRSAFTLAEVIITLIIIGVVAAITVPMLHNDVTDKKWNVARQKARATIGEAFKLMTVNGEITTKKADGTTMTTADFVNTVIPKYLKIEKTCAPADYQKCGFPETVKTPKGQTVTIAPNNYKWSEFSGAKTYKKDNPSGADISTGYIQDYTSKYGQTYNTTYFFRTLDGFSVAFFYNPYCISDKSENSLSSSGSSFPITTALDKMCLMGIYDMNGKSKPNKVGMDIGFVGSLYNGYQTVATAVLPHSEEKQLKILPGRVGDNYWGAANNYCNNIGKNHDWIMPDIDELTLLYLNYRLVGDGSSKEAYNRYFFSHTPAGNNNNYFACLFPLRYGGVTGIIPRNDGISGWTYVRCVRNTALK